MKKLMVPSKGAIDGSPNEEILPPDKLQTIAANIEQLASQAEALKRVDALLLDQGENYFELGGVLKRIHDMKWYDGFTSFGELCEEQFGFQRRKGEYLIHVHSVMADVSLDWNDVRKIGWSKMRAICSAHIEPGEVPGWLKKAEGMTVAELQQALKGLKGTSLGTIAKKVSVSFHPDQWETVEVAIDLVRDETGEDTPANQAIYLMAAEYSSGPQVPAIAPSSAKSAAPAHQNAAPKGGYSLTTHEDMIEWLNGMSMEEAAAVVAEAFPGYEICPLSTGQAKNSNMGVTGSQAGEPPSETQPSH